MDEFGRPISDDDDDDEETAHLPRKLWKKAVERTSLISPSNLALALSHPHRRFATNRSESVEGRRRSRGRRKLSSVSASTIGGR
eukprot:347038-Prorocentrum_minimum.AAC.1